MDGALRAMELSHATGFTIWNYNPRNSVRFGDSWNGEDFSIYSPDVFQQTASALSNHHLNLRSRPASVSAAKHEHYMRSVLGKLKLTPAMAHRFGSWYVGGRVLDAVIRPYAAKLAGRLESSRFEYKRKWFSLRFWTDPEQLHARDSASLVTEIFLPDYHFHVPSGSNFREYLDVHVSDGTVEYYAASQTLLYRHDPKSSHHVVNVHARQRMTRSTSTAESAKVEKEVGS